MIRQAASWHDVVFCIKQHRVLQKKAISGIFTQPDLSPKVTFGNSDFVMISGTYEGQILLPSCLSRGVIAISRKGLADVLPWKTFRSGMSDRLRGLGAVLGCFGARPSSYQAHDEPNDLSGEKSGDTHGGRQRKKWTDSRRQNTGDSEGTNWPMLGSTRMNALTSSFLQVLPMELPRVGRSHQCRASRPTGE